MKIAVGQFAPAADTAENLQTMRRMTEQAAAAGAELVVFPEEAMFSERLIGEEFEELVLRGWSGFVQQLSFLAARTGVAVIAVPRRLAGLRSSLAALGAGEGGTGAGAGAVPKVFKPPAAGRGADGRCFARAVASRTCGKKSCTSAGSKPSRLAVRAVPAGVSTRRSPSPSLWMRLRSRRVTRRVPPAS